MNRPNRPIDRRRIAAICRECDFILVGEAVNKDPYWPDYWSDSDFQQNCRHLARSDDEYPFGCSALERAKGEPYVDDQQATFAQVTNVGY